MGRHATDRGLRPRAGLGPGHRPLRRRIGTGPAGRMVTRSSHGPITKTGSQPRPQCRAGDRPGGLRHRGPTPRACWPTPGTMPSMWAPWRMSLVAVRLTLRPPSAARSFGNHRATILAALANAVLIAAVTVLIVVDSIHRLATPRPVRAGIVVVVASVALVVNGAAALSSRPVQRPEHARGRPPHGRRRPGLAGRGARPPPSCSAVPSATWLDPVSALALAAIIGYQAIGVAAGQRGRPPRVDPDRRRPRAPDRGHGGGPRRGRGPRPPRLEPVQRDAGPVGPPGPDRPSHPRGGPGRRGPGQGGDRPARSASPTARWNWSASAASTATRIRAAWSRPRPPPPGRSPVHRH